MAENPRQTSSNMSRVSLAIFIALIAYVLLTIYVSTPTLQYTELILEIELNNIESITIDGDGRINGKLIESAGKSMDFNSYISPELISDLNALLAENNIQVTYTPGGPTFFDTLISWLPLIIIIYIMYRVFYRTAENMSGQQFNFIKSKAKLASDSQKKVTFNEVAGANEAKEELAELVEFLKNPSKFTALGARIPKGVMLVGAPGTGKTLLARAVAGEAGVPFFSTSGSDFVEMFVGVGAARVRDLFENGKKNAPCIIFMDEIDAIGGARSHASGGLRHEEREQTLNQLLAEMDGFESSAGIIVIAATNMPNVLDKALLRAGRFDRRVIVDKPDMQGRYEILQIHAKNIPLEDPKDLKVLAKGTPGLVGADLEKLLNEAALNAAKQGHDSVTQEDLEFAKDKEFMGLARKSQIISGKEKKVIAYHEAGHAIVALNVSEADPLHKVTITPRGMSLGSTWQLPDGDKHNYSKTYLLSQLQILMGGRCSEELFLNEITTGASNDIERATELARRMVCEWGMSDLGPIKFGSGSDSFLGYRQNVGNSNSENTTQRVDKCVSDIISNARKSVTAILTNKRHNLEKLAEALLVKETLTGDEIHVLLTAKES